MLPVLSKIRTGINYRNSIKINYETIIVAKVFAQKIATKYQLRVMLRFEGSSN